MIDRVLKLPPEQEAIRAKCFHPSGSFIAFRKGEIEQSIPDRFEQIVAKYPDRLAVKTKDHVFTYDELNRAANRVARAVLSERGGSNEPVAILLERGAPVILAILGVLKAGKIYVPLNPSSPQVRVASMLKDSQASLLVTNNKNLFLARTLSENTIPSINIDEPDPCLSTANLGLGQSPDALACIHYTSGTTGEPKGVVQKHRNVLYNIMAYTNDIHVCAEDRLTLLYPCSSSASVRNLFGALLNGAGLYPFDVKEEDSASLAAWLRDDGITIYISVSTLFRSLAGALTSAEKFTQLRLIQLGSESVTPRDVELYKRNFSSSCIFTNRLGTTETGAFQRYFIEKETPLIGDVVPVGYEVEGMEVLLLNEEGREVGFNCVGEIAVRSRYISLGYWQRPDLTEAKFLPDPSGGEQRLYLTGDLGLMLRDGCLVHKGRKDLRVKVRGYGVELAEVEKALRADPVIKEVVVVARPNESGDARLLAYFTCSNQPRPSVSELRDLLKEKLPDYMIPSAFVFLDALPLLPNGKVDRLALLHPGKSRPDLDICFVAPRTPVEQEMSRIWAEILSLDEIGIHDNFFDLGGDSVTATRVVFQVIKKFQLELPLQSLFQAPTVAEMAAVIAKQQGKNLGEEELDRMLTELEALSDEEAKRLLAN